MAKKPTIPSRRRADVFKEELQPLRRSARIIEQKPFRFGDLPPELRNRVYAYALHEGLEKNKLRELTGHLTYHERRMVHVSMSYPARALSQVSRATRTESLGMYYSKNTFNVCIGATHSPRHRVNRLAALRQWGASTYGQLGAPSIRILNIRGLQRIGNPRRTFTIYTTNPIKPVSFDSPDRYKLSPYIQETDLTALVPAILRPTSKLELTMERIEMLVAALYLVAGLFDGLEDKQRVELLAKVATKAGQKNVLETGG